MALLKKPPQLSQETAPKTEYVALSPHTVHSSLEKEDVDDIVRAILAGDAPR